MQGLLALAALSLFALWQIADQALHGGFDARSFFTRLCILALAFGWICLRARVLAPIHEGRPPRSKPTSSIVVSGLLITTLLCVSEIGLRERPAESSGLAALLVHACAGILATLLVAAWSAHESKQRASRMSASPRASAGRAAAI